MRKHLVGLAAATSGLAAAVMAADRQLPTTIQLLNAPPEGGRKPKPTPKKGRPTKAEKKAAKRARTRGVQASDGEQTDSAWWSLVMCAAASIEDAANCLRDPDAKKQADGAAKHYREAAQKLWAARGVAPSEKVQLPEKARAGIEVLHRVVESLLTTSRYVDEEGEATMALADLSDCIADPPFTLAAGVLVDAKENDRG